MPSTLWTYCIIEQIKSYNICFLSYVPDSISEQILKLARQDRFFDLLPLAREEEGVGVVTGQYVGGQRGALLLPPSRGGDDIHARASLAIPYQIPMPLFIGCRGELGEFNPSQVPMGQALRPILDSLRIPHFELTHPEEVYVIVDGALKLAFALESPVAVLMSTQLAGWKDEK